MKDTVSAVRNAIFEQRKGKSIELIISSIEQMSTKLTTLSNKDQKSFLENMNIINDYFTKGDLLAVSDVLKFELLPLFKEED